jgi:hypothetical protein
MHFNLHQFSHIALWSTLLWPVNYWQHCNVAVSNGWAHCNKDTFINLPSTLEVVLALMYHNLSRLTSVSKDTELVQGEPDCS